LISILGTKQQKKSFIFFSILKGSNRMLIVFRKLNKMSQENPKLKKRLPSIIVGKLEKVDKDKTSKYAAKNNFNEMMDSEMNNSLKTETHTNNT
jgi:hypothetical protein